MADLLPPRVGQFGGSAYKGNFCEMYGLMLKNSLLFYTNLNFQRPISHLILIWNPLKFYHFWTLQIKLSIFGRTAMWMKCWEFYPQSWSVWQSCCVAQLPADLPPQNPIPFFYLLYPIKKKNGIQSLFL